MGPAFAPELAVILSKRRIETDSVSPTPPKPSFNAQRLATRYLTASREFGDTLIAMTAIWILRRRVLRICLGLCLAGSASAQNAVLSTGPGSVTIDASRLNGVISLDAPWRFHAGDDPRYADPNFDDSSWPLVPPGEDRLLAALHIPDIPDGRDWARLHIHILNATGHLAIALESRASAQYAFFANGKEAGRTKGFATETLYYNPQTAYELPMATDITLSVHLSDVIGGTVHYFPLTSVRIGRSEAMTDRISLAHYQAFEESWLSLIILSAVFFACVPFSIVLLLSQRRHKEYLWLAIYCFFTGVFYAMYPLIFLGALPYTTVIDSLPGFIVSLQLAACIEFVLAIAEARPTTAVRLVQALQFASPVMYACRFYQAMAVCGAISTVCWLIVVGRILLAAYRHGSKEAGLLAIPLLFSMLSALLAQAQNAFPRQLGEMWRGHLGGVGFMGPQIGHLLVIAGILAVVLYRFIRVSNAEEVAAAELEAARTVQQLLLPATAPSTPGFSVESVYLPARQVGGDFFLLLPALEGSNDQSLLAIMGDVSGKGLQAAMVVSTIIGGLRMQLSRQPGEVLAHLNRMLAGHVSGFATCCAVLIAPDGQMRIANAGNPSPYLNGEEIATLPGLPLGMVPEVMYEETTSLLEPGTQLTFVSDGVIEATSATGKELFGFERTLEISGKSASAIAEAATLFGIGAPQADDITVLTVVRA